MSEPATDDQLGKWVGQAWTHDGVIPDPTRCDECFETTEAGSALCAKCAWNRYDDQLDEWWASNPLPEADAS